MPRIGLLSDSHGRAKTTAKAVGLLLEHGVDRLIHLGDVGTVEVIDALVVPAPDGGGLMATDLVFGNVDWDKASLGRYAQGLGLHVSDPAGQIDVGNGQLAFCHGHETPPMRRAMEMQVRYLCHGHTHQAHDHQRGRTRVINPGALFRARTYTVAVLDTNEDCVEFLTVA